MKYRLQRCGQDNARTLVLSSGLGGVQGYWAPHLDGLLGAGFDLLLYDQSGCGENGALLGQDTIAAMADDVLAICDAAGVERFGLVGHALGGLIGFDLACRDQRRLERLVAINAWPVIDAHTARCFDIRLSTLETQGLPAFAALQQNFLYPPFWIAAHPERIACEEAHVVAHFQGTDTLRRRITALRDFRIGEWPADGPEVLLMATLDDALVDCAQSQRLAQKIPGAKLVEYPQGGHALNLTLRDRFETDLKAFLTDD